MGAVIRVVPTAPGAEIVTFPDTYNGRRIAESRARSIANETGDRVLMEREELPYKPFALVVWSDKIRARRAARVEKMRLKAERATERARRAAEAEVVMLAEVEKKVAAAFRAAPRGTGPSGASVYVLRSTFSGRESIDRIAQPSRRHMEHLACFGLVELVDGGRGGARITQLGRTVLLGAPTVNLRNGNTHRRHAARPSATPSFVAARGGI